MKPFKVGILQYTDRIHDMHNLAKYRAPPLMKVREYNQANWSVHEKQSYENDIHVETRYVLPTSIQDEINDKIQEYFSITHKEWCDLLSTVEAKDNRKRAAAQIKRLAAYKAEPENSDSNMPSGTAM